MNVLAFDIETVPDVELGRRLYNVADLDDESVAKIMSFKQKQARGTDFLPLAQQRIVAVSVVLRNRDALHIYSLGDEHSPERELVQRFFDGIERFRPELVLWNGCGFDLPVLNYRALRYGVTAARYWETGDGDRDFRYNNYLGRYHWRHIDLMDVLSGYQHGGRASLEQAALLLGLPGKLGMSGGRVWDAYLRGELGAIRAYCETDALNTYLIFLRFQLLRGALDLDGYRAETMLVEQKLEQSEAQHFKQFLEAWRANRDEL